jgi:hypothetical protein
MLSGYGRKAAVKGQCSIGFRHREHARGGPSKAIRTTSEAARQGSVTITRMRFSIYAGRATTGITIMESR